MSPVRRKGFLSSARGGGERDPEAYSSLLYQKKGARESLRSLTASQGPYSLQTDRRPGLQLGLHLGGSLSCCSCSLVMTVNERGNKRSVSSRWCLPDRCGWMGFAPPGGKRLQHCGGGGPLREGPEAGFI